MHAELVNVGLLSPQAADQTPAAMARQAAAGARGALLAPPDRPLIRREAGHLESMETTMSEQTKDCEVCKGKGDDAWMTEPARYSKILHRPCRACDGTGKQRESSTPTTRSRQPTSPGPRD
jgi:hypothetical protein